MKKHINTAMPMVELGTIRGRVGMYVLLVREDPGILSGCVGDAISVSGVPMIYRTDLHIEKYQTTRICSGSKAGRKSL